MPAHGDPDELLGMHGLRAGTGRFCWAVSGTLCGGTVRGSFAQKRYTCMTCDFFLLVRSEAGPNDFVLLR